MQYSNYQLALFEEIMHGTTDIAVDAKAGSGKTFSIKEALKLATEIKSAIVCAFNKHIEIELNEKFAKEKIAHRAFTSHSVGFRAISAAGYRTKDDKKYEKILEGYFVYRYGANLKNIDEHVRQAAKLVDFARMTLTDATSEQALRAMALEYGFMHELEYFDTDWRAVAPALKRGLNKITGFDFTDMLYLPVVLDLPVARYSIVLVDECQDLSEAQLQLVMKLRAAGGRMVFVGDPDQAIYAFAGANCNSFENIVRKTSAKIMPLSVCYRCPISHIELAQQLVPQIEAAPNAKRGTILFDSVSNIETLVQEGDLILCRYTAPLINVAYQLIKAGIAARVKGRNMTGGLKSIVNKVAKIEGFEFSQFLTYFKSYKDLMIARLVEKGADEAALTNFTDQIEVIELIYTNATPALTSVRSLCDAIDKLFSDERASVWLSTVHRAKGLEAKRVMLLQAKSTEEINEKMPAPAIMSALMPWPFAKTADAMKQEKNLRYVALTRATDTLIFLRAASAIAAKEEQKETALAA